jgi:hypothetical protein
MLRQAAAKPRRRKQLAGSCGLAPGACGWNVFFPGTDDWPSMTRPGHLFGVFALAVLEYVEYTVGGPVRMARTR